MVASRKCERVIAVEPQRDLCELMRRDGRPNVDIRQTAIGLHEGSADLSVPVNRGAASFNHHDGNIERVPVSELFRVVEDSSVVKFDLEGDDAAVLAANADYLGQWRIIIFEETQGKPSCFKQVKDAGYTIWKANDGQHMENPPELPEGFYVNLVGVAS